VRTFGNIVKILALGFFVGILCFAIPRHVMASEPVGIQVTPLRAYPAQQPGSTTKGSLTLTNYTTSPQYIALSVESFKTINEAYDYSFGSDEATKWVQFAEPFVTLAPKQSKVAEYTIAVPSSAAPGGKYLSLVSTISPTAGTQGVTEIHRVASLVYLQVNGALTKKGQLLSFDLPKLSTRQTVTAQVRVANAGNTHFESRVGFSVQRWLLGSPTNDNFQVKGIILPGTVRQLSTKIHTPSLPGLYRVTADYSPPQGGTIKLSHLVLYIPIWFMIILVLALGTIIVFVIRLWRTHKRT
jgi:hypothetical protein